MRNFTCTFNNITKIFILFYFLTGTLNSYGQNKKLVTSKPDLKQSSAEGNIYIGSDKISTGDSDKAFINTIVNPSKTSKTSKMTADTEPPVLICPPDQLLACGSLVPSYFALLSATDNVDSSISVWQNPGPGSKFYNGMQIKFTGMDAAGNIGECSIIVRASSPDVTPPTFTCPTGLTLNCGDVIPNYAISPIMNLSDDCSLNLSYRMTPGAGSTFYDGMPIQIEYFDQPGNVGNRSVCNFTIGMATPDITSPEFTYCPGTQTLSCGSFLPDYKPLITATDNCLGDLFLSQSPDPGTVFTPGMTVTMTLRDAANNTSTCSFVVNASGDTTKPVITCPGDQTLTIGDLLPDYKSLVTVSDNCDASTSLVQNPPVGSPFTVGMPVTFTATDASGNVANCVININSLSVDLPPVIVCPPTQELYANSTLPDYVSYLNTVTDDITDGFDLVFTQTPPQGTLFTADTNVTITATDEIGNTNSCTFLVKLKTATTSIDCKTTSFNVSNLDGLNGFTIYGEKLTRRAGFSVSNAGDVNGDGISDLIIGAPGSYEAFYGPRGIYKVIKGAAFVVFGKASGFSPNIDLGLLDGSNGFAIRNDNPSFTSNSPETGFDVSTAGDINGDGIDDFMISDPYRNTSYGSAVGHTYIIFGKNSGFPSEFNLSTLDGTNGFTLIGLVNYAAAGTQISAIGDVNGDGFNDIAAVTSGSGEPNGKCFVVYGKSSGFPAVLRTNELDGTNGFSISGEAARRIGTSVAGLGDINGDGITDIGIGSYYNGSYRKFVVFGRSSNFPSSFSVSSLNGSNGFILENSVDPLDSNGEIAKAGDLNNDGINDIAVTGKYILFGRTSFPSIVDLSTLDGTNGFTISISTSNSFGYAGDFNADGIDDYFVGSLFDGTYILLGKNSWSAVVDFNVDKIILLSTGIGNYSASYAGDVNNDGISDFIIGVPYTSTLKVNRNPGMSFVIFGKKISDKEKPVITNCPSNQILVAGATIPNYVSQISVTDNCDNNPAKTQSPAAGTIFNGATQNVTITVIDASGNTEECTFSISTADTEAPVITNCLIDQIVACSTTVLANYRDLIEATDNVDLSPVVTQNPVEGSPFTDGMTVTMRATDATGNFETCSFVVNASADITKPVITCPGNQALTIGDLLPDYKSLVTVSDDCDVNPSLVQNPPVGSPFTVGMPVTFTATDASGNVASCVININSVSGDLPPVIVCPPTQELYANSTLPDYVSYLNTVTDDITDGFDLVFTQTPPQGTLFTADTNVTITVTDEIGNTNSCTFLVKLKTTTTIIDCRTSTFNVANLNGLNGFTIYGEKLTREAGFSVSNAGDVNGDGISDLIIGAPGNYEPWYGPDRIYKIINGGAFVVFGKASGFTANIDLGLLDGNNGFAIRNDLPNTNFPVTGYDVSTAGDINGDGIDDFMVSDPVRVTSYGAEVGHVYIIFGRRSGFPADFKLSTLNGTNGFTLIGVATYGNVGNQISAIGDVNGDGFNDIAAVTRGSGEPNGKCFVVYGKSGGFPAVLRTNQLDGTNGFTIDGDPSIGKVGTSVAGLGDINGDGINDIGIGSYYNGSYRKFVVFGRSSNFPSSFSTSSLNGSNGFILENSVTALGSYTGIAKAGDINNDGINDIAVTGKYILFGRTSFPSIVDLSTLDGTNGFTITSSIQNSFGYAGDFNADGIDDYFVSSYNEAYILFGKNNWPANVSFSVDKSLRFTYGYSDDYSASYAGDINNDGISDFIIGKAYDSYGSNLKVNRNPGMSFVIFGKRITDTEKPVITNCPGNQILAPGAEIPDYATGITVTDNCDDNPTKVQTPLAGTLYDGTALEVTLTVTDASGNTETCTFPVSSIADTENPVITCPSDQTADCAITVLADYTSLASATDNMGPSPVITQSPAAGSAFTDGMTVTLTATDASENSSSCSFRINVSDTEKPVITNCPTNKILATGTEIPDYTTGITVTDNCDDTPTKVQTPLAGTLYDGTTLEVTITATDASGNTETCKFTVSSVADTEDPVITCPSDQTADCATTVLADYTSLAAATDNMDPAPVITQSPVAGSAFTNGMTVTLTATDASENTSSCTFRINVSDTEKPVITNCPTSKILAPGTEIPDYTTGITVTDNCDDNPTKVQTPLAGTLYDGTALEVTITATDASGNTETCKFPVSSIADTEDPVITCPSDQTVDCSTTVLEDYTSLASATDNRIPAPVITQSPVAGSAFTDGMIVTLTATDASENTSSCTFRINVSDTEKPVITNCPTNKILATGAEIPDYATAITVTDNCDDNPTKVQTPLAGTLYDGTALEVTITVTDASGNTETCTFPVSSIADTENPVITCPSDQTADCATTVLADYTSLASATDNMDPSPVITQSPVAGSAFTDGMTITLTATDASENSSSCTFRIFSEILIVDAGTDAEIQEGQFVQLEAISTEEGSFRWSPSEGVSDAMISNPSFSPAITTTYKVIFTNKKGCRAEDSVTITVIPKEKDETKYGFSPNNDGINDVWVIDHITEYPNNTVSIYNRWGDLVFETTGYNNTTNVFAGIANKKRKLGADQLPEGTYFFEINPNSTSHNFKKLKGYLVLKR